MSDVIGFSGRDKENFIRAATDLDWEVVAQNGSVIIARGPEQIEIEYGSAGIPRKVKRTDVDGKTTILTQNYIRMIEVLGWLAKP